LAWLFGRGGKPFCSLISTILNTNCSSRVFHNGRWGVKLLVLPPCRFYASVRAGRCQHMIASERSGEPHAQCADRLQRVMREPSKDKVEATTRHFLSSFNARVCAAVRALVKCRKRATLTEICALAERLDVLEPLSEPVRVRVVPKSKGGFRFLVKYGPVGWHSSSSSAIYSPPCVSITTATIHVAARKVRRRSLGKSLESRSKAVRYWKSADVQECFASLRPAHFRWPPLPEELLRNVVFIPKCARILIVWTSHTISLLMSRAS
jgi:hypothetical protein